MKNKNLKFLESFSFCFANRGYAPRCAPPSAEGKAHFFAWAASLFCKAKKPKAEGQSPPRCGTHFLPGRSPPRCGAKKSGAKQTWSREVKARHSPKLRLCLDRNLVKGTVQSVSNSFLCFLKNKESKKLILCLCIKSRSCTFTTFK